MSRPGNFNYFGPLLSVRSSSRNTSLGERAKAVVAASGNREGAAVLAAAEQFPNCGATNVNQTFRVRFTAGLV